jgi:cupin 2 domain-containing protein
MLAARATDGNLFDGIDAQSPDAQSPDAQSPNEQSPGEQLSDLLNTPGLKIERIVSTGQVTEPGTWLDQACTEWVLLVSGAATILFEDESEQRPLKTGDYLMIEAHRRHRVIWTKEGESTIWLAVHFGDVALTSEGD